ncbi:MAG: NTP transferase domain-containing protein, partial [Actinomycetota bacterium]|nr:NTP transferase domain-containing protein [Actinomycetota bacterium]
VADIEPLAGPLPALSQVLGYFGRGHVLICPCDLPLLTGSHVRLLLEALRSHDGDGPARAVVAQVNGRPQPSLGVWPASWALAARRAVSDGRRAFRDALELGRWTSVDLPPAALADADTPETLEELLRFHDPGSAGAAPTDLD